MQNLDAKNRSRNRSGMDLYHVAAAILSGNELELHLAIVNVHGCRDLSTKLTYCAVLAICTLLLIGFWRTVNDWDVEYNLRAWEYRILCSDRQYRIGDATGAEHALTTALDLLPALGPPDLKQMVSINRLAGVKVEKKDFAEALQLYGQVLSLYKTLTPTVPTTVTATEHANVQDRILMAREALHAATARGQLLSKAGNCKAARDSFQEALEIADFLKEPANNSDKLIVADAANSLDGLVRLDVSEGGALLAVKTLNRLKEFDLSTLPSALTERLEGDARIIDNATSSTNNVFAAYMVGAANQRRLLDKMAQYQTDIDAADTRKDHLRAIKLLREAIPEANRLGSKDNHIVTFELRLIRKLIEQEDWPSASQQLALTRRHVENAFGENSKQMDDLLGIYDLFYQMQNRTSEDEKCILERIKVREAIRGPASSHVAETLYYLAGLHVRIHQQAKARDELKKALKIWQEDQPDSKDAARALRLLQQLSDQSH
jgi:tetratricopeptide (TPR) repeat protein